MDTWIKFLGTAGARFVMLRQIRSSAGVWYRLNGLNVLLDPGPGTLLRCAKSRPRLDPASLDAIILSHKHLDHSTDVNVMIEGMTDGGFKKRGKLFAPADALDTDPVVLKYLRDFPEEIHVLNGKGRYRLSDEVQLETPVRHRHPVETYGIKFYLPGLVIAHVTDTAYFDELIPAYAGAQVLILHVVRFEGENDPAKGILHLNLKDAERLIAEIRPRVAILTHFGMTMLKAKPWEQAKDLSQKLGIRVLAAGDGWTFEPETQMGGV